MVSSIGAYRLDLELWKQAVIISSKRRNNIEYMNKYILILCYVILSSIGMNIMKKAISWRSGNFLLGLCIFGTSSITWLITLRVSPIATTFPLATGLLTIATTLVGRYSLKEKFSNKKIMGTFMILAGIIAMEYK